MAFARTLLGGIAGAGIGYLLMKLVSPDEKEFAKKFPPPSLDQYQPYLKKSPQNPDSMSTLEPPAKESSRK